ncbi:VOC family protein [Runella slithyformis]|uniref:Glyoxalase/bleomycin resistance protein/dioxygenase n=1 Tax=Runella slithyformis (strain ATCC 29530 / DSM 19594 / LMG 11500 / NCIMB 11436 / LSU 4) TaxID=761193 RepID=A0A7U3ZID4_RUNSL|nr:VOC family protein [Runella slithyformis]AEI47765.1 Glyoxalase/bleomycin resistance protein/dioxygenase [Runella slithyformis DSM 19594]
MQTNRLLKGLHHVTATVNDAQEDYDFYTQLLGLRLVKKTVNFDNNFVYHFYYADQVGTPGTVFTTFPYKGHGVRQGEEGSGMIISTAFSVLGSSLDFWQRRLTDAGISVVPFKRFEQHGLWFRDPSGLQLELIADDSDPRIPFETHEIDTAVGIRGIHHVTLWVATHDWDVLRQFLTAEMNMEEVAREENRIRLNVHEGGAGSCLELLLAEPTVPRGKNGLGTVHHVAWKIENEEAQLALRHRLAEELGMQVTEVKDRKYFRSIYFRLPSGQLFEVATEGPGFDVDESVAELGTHLMLPDDKEYNRAVIEARLPEIHL